MAATAHDERNPLGWRGALYDVVVVTGMREAALRFPVVVLFLVLATVQANLLPYPLAIEPFLQRFGLTDNQLLAGLVGGTMAALAAVLFAETRALPTPARVLLSLAAGVATTSAMVLSGRLHVLDWTFLLATAGLVPVLPFLGRGRSSTLWMFTFRMAVAAAFALLALVLFAIGVQAVFASLEPLFAFRVPSKLYEHVLLSIGFLVAPMFGLGQLPYRFDEEPGPDTLGFMDRGLRALGDFLAVPLLVLMTAILHIYALKIIVTQEVPQGEVGSLVLTYGLCVLAAVLLLSACREGARAPTHFFLRFWPLFLPVPLVLLGYAVMVRVSEYGLTPARYLLGLFAALTAVILALQVPARTRGDIRFITAIPVFALLLGSFGPQGALSLALDSQAARFRKLMASQPVEGERHRQALAMLRFFSHRNAIELVAPAGTDLAGSKDDVLRRTAEAWGLRLPSGREEYVVRRVGEAVIPLDGFDTGFGGVSLHRQGETARLRVPGGNDLVLALAPDGFVMTLDGESVHFPVTLQQAEAFARIPVDQPALLSLQAGSRRIAIAPTIYYVDLIGKKGLRRVRGLILLRKADWQ